MRDKNQEHVSTHNCEDCGRPMIDCYYCDDEWVCEKCDDGFCPVCGQHFDGLGHKDDF